MLPKTRIADKRVGDADSNNKILAETNKLTENSMNGTTATNKEKHRKIAFCNENNVSRSINDPFCRQCNQLNGTNFEVEMSKKTFTLDLPLRIACFVYKYGKLRMLKFCYDSMDIFVDRRDFQYYCMDTYSAYMGLSAECLEEVIKPELTQRIKVKSTTGFQGLIPPNMPHMIGGHRGSSKKNTEEMQLLPYVVKHIIVLGSRTNSAAKESIND
jgi:hypothetical protein